ncbi:MAG: hypothetical protein ACOC44_12865 [Promethearchaeia archaeon]
MIQKLLICDSQGYPFYSRNIDESLPEMNRSLLSGLISAIGTIGDKIFNKKIANISFGNGSGGSYISIVTKDLLFEEKSIYFVFFMQGKCDTRLIKEISTTIFIENKQFLKNPDAMSFEIEQKVDATIKNRFSGLREC